SLRPAPPAATWGPPPPISCPEPVATTSAARLDINPMPPTIGNINAAATTPARKQQIANLQTVTPVGRPSDMHPGYSRCPSNSVNWRKRQGASRFKGQRQVAHAPN